MEIINDENMISLLKRIHNIQDLLIEITDAGML